MKRAPIGDPSEQEKEAEREKQLFAETLKKLKAGAIVGFNASKKELESLKVSKLVQKEIIKYCGKNIAPIKTLFTRVNKLVTLTWQIDLSDGLGPNSPVLQQKLQGFDPLPHGPLELISGQLQWEPHTDRLLFHNAEVTEITHDAPFEMCLTFNFHEYVLDTISTIGNTKMFNEKRLKHEPFAVLKDYAGQQGFLKMEPHSDHVRPPENVRKVLNVDRNNEESRQLANFQPEMASICAVIDETNIWNGTVSFQMPHPISQKTTDFVAIHYTHIVAIVAVQNWRQWNLTVGPLTGSATTTLDKRVFFIFEKEFCKRVAAELVAEFPQRPPLFPKDSMCFGICRTIEDSTTWVTPEYCSEEITCAQDLAKVFTVSVDVMLDYSLLPRSIGHRALTMVSGGNALRGMLGYDNVKEHERELKEQARAEIAQGKVAVDLSQIEVDDEEGEGNEEPSSAPTQVADAMET
jgi:hypothetical protein